MVCDPRGVDTLMTEKKRTELLAHRAHRPHRCQAGADQVAHRLMRRVWHAGRRQKAAPMHREARRVAAIGLLAFRRHTPWDKRRRDNDVVVRQPGQRAVDAIAAGAAS
jgi:hypothetical protein